jgi:hypothetical protein
MTNEKLKEAFKLTSQNTMPFVSYVERKTL